MRRIGAGAPMVALHGSGGGLHSWAGVAERLADRHEVWLVARRGHGPSDRPTAANTFAAEVGDVRAVLVADALAGFYQQVRARSRTAG